MTDTDGRGIIADSGGIGMYQAVEEGQRKTMLYLYNPNQTETTNSFCDALCNKVIKKRFGSVQIKYVDSSVSAGHVPLLTVCHNYSRIGTDIDHATSGLEGINREHMGVVVLHTRELHALPMTMPTENLTDPKYERFGKLVDFAYTPEKGLYQCNMNTVGEQKLTVFLEHYLQRSESRMPSVRGTVQVGSCGWSWKRICICFFVLLAIAGVISVICLIATHALTHEKHTNATTSHARTVGPGFFHFYIPVLISLMWGVFDLFDSQLYLLLGVIRLE